MAGVGGTVPTPMRDGLTYLISIAVFVFLRSK